MENTNHINNNEEEKVHHINSQEHIANSSDVESVSEKKLVIEEGPDFFERQGKKAIWLALGLAACIAFYVYKDFLLFNNVLLYTDIGSDSVNIFYPVWAHYADLWRESGIPSWTMQWAMGNNVAWGLLMDPFSLVLYIIGKTNIPYAIVYIEVFKVLLSVIFIYKYLQLLKLSNLTCIIGALLYSFSGYLILGSSGWYIHSLEALMISFFLMVVEKYINKNSLVWVIIFSFIMAWTNFILLVQLLVIFTAYVIFRNYEKNINFKQTLKSLVLGVCAYGIGALLAFPSLKAAFDAIFKSGRAESLSSSDAVSQIKQTTLFSFSSSDEYYSMLCRLFSNDLLGTGNDYKGWFNYLESPILYMGLPCIIFIAAQFFGFSSKQKLLYGFLIFLYAVLLVFPWFRFAYWGFNLNYFRSFGFFITIILFFIAIQGLNNFFKNKANNKFLLYIIGFMFVILFIYPADISGKIDNPQRMFISLFLLLYAIVIYLYNQSKNRNELKFGFLAIVVIELGLQSHTTVNNRNTLTHEDIQAGKLYGDSTLQVLDWIKQQDTGFFRVAKYYPSGPAQHMSMNDAMVQGFNGLIGYSSLHNRYYMRFLNGTNCIDPKQPDDIKWTYKILSRPYLSSFAGAKYFIDKDSVKLDTINFKFLDKIHGIYVYQSNIANSIAVAYEQYITEKEFKTLSKWNKDYVLFKALVISAEKLKDVIDLKHFDLNDTITKDNKTAFILAAKQQQALLKQNLKVTNKEISGSLETTKPCVINFLIPYDENWKLELNGNTKNYFVGDFGFICFKQTQNKTTIKLTY